MKNFTSLIATLLVASSTLAEETPRNFGFQPLEIYKFKMGSSRLIVDDLDNDGFDDILFANNHVSRLEILLRKPNGENTGDLPELEERFDNKGIIVDQQLKSVRVADLDNDGRKDIVTFGPSIGLQIRHQQENGTFAEPRRVFIKDRSSVATVQLGDLNGDGLKDILICHRDRAELYWNAAERPFQEQKTLTFSGDKCYYGNIADINADGIPDLAFHFNTARNPLVVRYGTGAGRYGIEQPVDLPPRQYMDILQADGEAPQIGMVLQNRLAFRTYGFEEREQPSIMEAQEIAPRRIGLEGANRKSPPAWLAADFDEDGYGDLLVAAPELSRLHLYSGNAEGLDPEPQRIDTLSGVERISRLSNGDLLVISKKEKIAAIHSAADFERFPQILQTPGDVLAGSAVESGNETWLVCKNADKELKLVCVPNNGTEGDVHPLDLQNDPADLLAFSLPEGKTGIILFMPYDAPKMMLAGANGLKELTSESFRALAQQLERGNIRLENPGDGTSLIVSQGAIARRFEWKSDHYEATRQFNPENPRGELIASCGFGFLGGSKGTFFYDRNAGDLVHFSSEGENWGKIHLPDADPTIFGLAQLENKRRDVVILLDRTGLNEIMGNGKRLEAVATAEYISPSENPLLAYAKHIELGAPPKPMAALVDPSNRTIELIARTNGELKPELVFEVFLVSDFAARNARGSEPHDLESGDLNGDGIGDLVVLSQDKLLIYLGE